MWPFVSIQQHGNGTSSTITCKKLKKDFQFKYRLTNFILYFFFFFPFLFLLSFPVLVRSTKVVWYRPVRMFSFTNECKE